MTLGGNVAIGCAVKTGSELKNLQKSIFRILKWKWLGCKLGLTVDVNFIVKGITCKWRTSTQSFMSFYEGPRKISELMFVIRKHLCRLRCFLAIERSFPTFPGKVLENTHFHESCGSLKLRESDRPRLYRVFRKLWSCTWWMNNKIINKTTKRPDEKIHTVSAPHVFQRRWTSWGNNCHLLCSWASIVRPCGIGLRPT